MNFTNDILRKLYDQYASRSFLDAADFLLNNNNISQEYEEILSNFSSMVKNDLGIIRRSHFLYLSNAIISIDGDQKVEAMDQFFFEMAVEYVRRTKNEVNLRFKKKKMFSVSVNRFVEGPFDKICFRDGNIVFISNGTEVCTIYVNSKCILAPGVSFLMEDVNPFNVNNEHPEHHKNFRYDLDKFSIEDWVSHLRRAFQFIRDKTPSIFDEISYFLHSIGPHGYMAGKQLSSTYSKSPGILYVSYTDLDIQQAEAIIHETNHTIFNVIDWKYKLVKNDSSLKFYSAYRPDARHIRGCFIGLHAFVSVQNFYRVLAEEQGLVEHVKSFLPLYLKNEKVIKVLSKYADFTEEGKFLFEDVVEKFNSDRKFFDEIRSKNPSILDKIIKEVEGHLESAKTNNSVLLY